MRDLSLLPSPYLTGEFDREDPAMWHYAVVETNRGCPCSCIYCSWGCATGDKIHEIPMDRIVAEIEWIAKRRLQRIWIVDANFGILERDVEIAAAVAEARRRFGFPQRFTVNYEKNSTRRVADIVSILADADVAAAGMVSIETTDETVLERVHRKNPEKHRLDDLIEVFRERNMPLTTELMMGLPGSTVETVKNDLQFCFDRRLCVTTYQTLALPNSPMMEPECVEAYGIGVGEDGLIRSTYSFTEADLEEMKRIASTYRLFDTFGLLRYVLWYLQCDHGLRALDFIHDLSRLVEGPSEAFPLTSSLFRDYSIGLPPLPDGSWCEFFDEIAAYLGRRYGLPLTSGLRTSLSVQRFVMPEVGRYFPESIHLEHDFPAYYRETLVADPADRRPLEAFAPVDLRVTDPHGVCETLRRGEVRGVAHFVLWELETVLSLDKPALFGEASPTN